jgi:hypothetical protein
MDKDLQVLMNNYNCLEDTFIYRLSEEFLFDLPLFWEYYNSVREVIRHTLDKPLDRGISRAVSGTYSRILENIISEYSDNCIGLTKNFPYHLLQSLMERLSFMVDGYFQGYLINESRFDEELQNPILFKADEINAHPSIIQLVFCKTGLHVHALGFRDHDGSYQVFLNEEEDNFLVDSRLRRGEVEGRFLFSVPDASTAYLVFHEWVMKTYSPYSTNE